MFRVAFSHSRGNCESVSFTAHYSHSSVFQFVDCSSEQTAFFLIDNTGAIGGIFGSNSTDTNPDGCGGNEVTTTLSPASSNPAPVSTSSSQVTVTVTLSEPTTLAPVTTTLSPEEASGILSSLIAGGGTIVKEPFPEPTFTTSSTPTFAPLSQPGSSTFITAPTTAY